MNHKATALLCAVLLLVGVAPAAAPAAPALAVVLEIGQGAPGGAAGVQGAISGVSVQDAVLAAVGEALQAKNVAVYGAARPGVPVLGLAGQLSVTQQQVLLANREVVDVALYARLTGVDGLTWYAHGSGAAAATTMANPYGYGGYGAQAPAGTVRAAIQRAAAALVTGIVTHLTSPAPCAQPTPTPAQP